MVCAYDAARRVITDQHAAARIPRFCAAAPAAILGTSYGVFVQEGKLLLQEELSWQQTVLRAQLAAGRLQRLFELQEKQPRRRNVQHKQQQQLLPIHKAEGAAPQYCGGQQRTCTSTGTSNAAAERPLPAAALAAGAGAMHPLEAAFSAAFTVNSAAGSTSKSGSRTSTNSGTTGSAGNNSSCRDNDINVKAAHGEDCSKTDEPDREALHASPFLEAVARNGKCVEKRGGKVACSVTPALRGKRIAHYMTCNRAEDVVLRLAAAISGYVPVTVNWDADSIERILYKIEAADCQAVIVDRDVDPSHLRTLQRYAAGRIATVEATAATEQDAHDKAEKPSACTSHDDAEHAAIKADAAGSVTAVAGGHAADEGFTRQPNDRTIGSIGDLAAQASAEAAATAAVAARVARCGELTPTAAPAAATAPFFHRPILILAAEGLCAVPELTSPTATQPRVDDDIVRVLINHSEQLPRPLSGGPSAAAEDVPRSVAGSVTATREVANVFAAAAATFTTAELGPQSLSTEKDEYEKGEEEQDARKNALLNGEKAQEGACIRVSLEASTKEKEEERRLPRTEEKGDTQKECISHSLKRAGSSLMKEAPNPMPAIATRATAAMTSSSSNEAPSPTRKSVAPTEEEGSFDYERLVVFTSGTTGTPRGAVITYRNLETSCQSLYSLLGLKKSADLLLSLVLVNPLHHINSSVLLELAFRYPRARVTLFTRYTTHFWEVLCKIAEQAASAAGVQKQGSSSRMDSIGNKGSCSDESKLGDEYVWPPSRTCSNYRTDQAFMQTSNRSINTFCCNSKDSGATEVGSLAVVKDDVGSHSSSSTTRSSSTSRRASTDGIDSSKTMEKETYRVVVPLVSRHVDFLQALVESGRLLTAGGCSRERLATALHAKEVVLLMGSAPVGERTIKNLQECLGGKFPLIRFGSTETTLQVAATPLKMTPQEMDAALQRGWRRTCASSREHKGFYIGRPHPPFTELRVVKSIEASHPDYMVDCEEGEAGNLICRGRNTVKKYVDGSEPAHSVDGWYLGLGDIGYYMTNEKSRFPVSSSSVASSQPVTLPHTTSALCPSTSAPPCPPVESAVTGSPSSRERDFYWVTRSAELIIKGGANYSCAQVAEDIKCFLLSNYPALSAARASVEVGVVGLKLDSEHEDACCITLDIEFPQVASASSENTSETNERCASVLKDIKDTLMQRVRNGTGPHALSKGSKPDRVRFAKIPRNFKGAVDIPTLKKNFLEYLCGST